MVQIRKAISTHRRPILTILVITAVLWTFYVIRAAILPFAVGLILAYILSPIVTWVAKLLPPHDRWEGTRRSFAILIVFLVMLGLIALFFYYIITAVVNSFSTILQNVPFFIAQSIARLQESLNVFAEQLPEGLRIQVQQGLVDAGAALGNNIRDILVRSVSFGPRTIGTILGFAALPFFLFYLIKDSTKIRKWFFSLFPSSTRTIMQDIVAILERVLGRYVRAQLLLGMIVGYFSFVGLIILQVPFAPVLAALAGATEIIPTLGPWIGGGFAFLVTLALTPDKALWVAVLFLVVQLIENNLLVPRIQSAYLNIHPAAMIFLLVAGSFVAGFWGLLLAAPLAATVLELIKYFRRRFGSPAEENPPAEG